MTKVDADHASSFHVDHEVGQMAVSDAEDPVADTQQSMRADEVGSQGQEGLRAVAHPQERPPARREQNRVTPGSPSTPTDSAGRTYFSRSAGTCCSTLRKFFPASPRLAFLFEHLWSKLLTESNNLKSNIEQTYWYASEYRLIGLSCDFDLKVESHEL